MTNISSRSPVLLEIPHFASNAGAERETVVLRSNDGETWTLHVSDTVHDGEIYQVLIFWFLYINSYTSLVYSAEEALAETRVQIYYIYISFSFLFFFYLYNDLNH